MVEAISRKERYITMRKTLQKYRESLLLLVIMLLLCVFFSGPGKKYTNWEIQKDYLERNAPESFLLTVNGVELTMRESRVDCGVCCPADPSLWA